MAGDAARQILDDVILAVTGLATTGSNVFEDPTHAIEAGKIPAVAVEPLQNPAEPLGESQDEDYIERHEFRVRLTVLAESPAQRDTSILEVKRAIIAGPISARERRYVDTLYGSAGEGAKSYYAAQILFDLEFLTSSQQPDVLV